jgi:hypothetical protein
LGIGSLGFAKDRLRIKATDGRNDRFDLKVLKKTVKNTTTNTGVTFS